MHSKPHSHLAKANMKAKMIKIQSEKIKHKNSNIKITFAFKFAFTRCEQTFTRINKYYTTLKCDVTWNFIVRLVIDINAFDIVFFL